MKLVEKIEQDLNEALKAGEASKVSVLRLLKSALHNQQIAGGEKLSEQDVIKVLNKEAKQRQESIASFESGGRAAMAAQEAQELEIIKEYLPAQLSAAEIDTLIAEVIESTGAQELKDMGMVMAEVSKRAAGKTDMGQVGQLVKTQLSK